MPVALAFRYARALADATASSGTAAEAVAADLSSFEQALAETPDLYRTLESPAVPQQRKRAVVTRLAQMLALSDVVRKFLLVVIDRRRIRLLRDIREGFEAVMDERGGVVRADVTSASELSEAQKTELLASLSRMTGKRMRACFSTSEELIGGVLARVGSTVYDGSVQSQLEGLKRHLAGTKR
jgi:F-type H+-transporting ATPase subunit delta